ncbi:MAG: hypothetical protein KAT34_01705 [Candidatus Aminicenantes bacterium]|nr:hypothetical protein [Candidatus Aminicenantes bacterium]
MPLCCTVQWILQKEIVCYVIDTNDDKVSLKEIVTTQKSFKEFFSHYVSLRYWWRLRLAA